MFRTIVAIVLTAWAFKTTLAMKGPKMKPQAAAATDPEASLKAQNDADLKDIFRMMDTNKNGVLDKEEIIKDLEDMGAPRGFQWRQFDKDGDRNLSMEEYKKMLATVVIYPGAPGAS